MFYRILILLIATLTFSGCMPNKFDYIDYSDNEMGEKILEEYSSKFDKFDFENLIQEGFEKQNEANFDYKEDWYGTLYVNYNLSLDVPDETYGSSCNISYMIKNGIFFYDAKFNKKDIVKMGRKKYYSELKRCLDKNMQILEKRKQKKIQEEAKVKQKLSEKI